MRKLNIKKKILLNDFNYSVKFFSKAYMLFQCYIEKLN